MITPFTQMGPKALRLHPALSLRTAPSNTGPTQLCLFVCSNSPEIERVEISMRIQMPSTPSASSSLQFFSFLFFQADVNMFLISWSPFAILTADLAGANLAVGKRGKHLCCRCARSPFSWVRAMIDVDPVPGILFPPCR